MKRPDTTFLFCLTVPILLLSLHSAWAEDFQSDFEHTPDRVWPGKSYWPNPMENWRIRDGRLECMTSKTGRNLHILTRTIGKNRTSFTLQVTLGMRGNTGDEKRHFKLKDGASLEADSEKPRVQNRALTLRTEVSQWGDQGVLIAQGGQAVGFSLYVKNGKPVFAVRNNGDVKKISASNPVQSQKGTVHVQLHRNGRATLKFNGTTIASGSVGVVGKLPIDGLQVGRDSGTQVGHYNGPSPFQGKINQVTLKLGKRKQSSSQGAAGFEVGVNSSIDDYRASVFRGNGLYAVLTDHGQLHIGKKSTSFSGSLSDGPVQLTLHGEPKQNEKHALFLRATQSISGKTNETTLQKTVSTERIAGAIRLTHNPGSFVDNQQTSFWFQHLQMSGKNVRAHPDRAFGPILWSMYTLHNSTGENGHILKLSAQMPPLGTTDNRSVRLQIKDQGNWTEVDRAHIDPDARNAIFRVPNWPADQDVPYRIVYQTRRTDGRTVQDTHSGVIQNVPDSDQKISIADLNCQKSYAFPYEPVVDNLQASDPDMLFFAGDQLYEGNGGYGIVRRPADRAIISYLRQYFMFGWAFGDAMRNRPTICIPDDHDVFQGNLWGSGGDKLEGGSTSTNAGYIEPVRTVNAIYRTQTGHNPNVQNRKPAERGVRVFHGEFQYGWLSMAILSDRQFKSGPKNVDTGSGRPDIVKDQDVNTEKLDQPGLKMLGERQLTFLKNWVRDWEQTKMKTVLSQTTFSNPMTHTGPNFQRVYADLDSNGWPQSGRNRALRVLRKGFSFHLAGDQHLATLVQHGIKKQRDSIWTYVAPAIAVGWPRQFKPDQENIPHQNRPDPGRPNTGEYLDGFQNKMYVYAVGNPPVKKWIPDAAPGRYKKAHRKASGFGEAIFDPTERTITTNAYPFYAGLDRGNPRQFPGWPATVNQTSNYGRDRVGRLPAVSMEGVEHPVVKVYDQNTEELVYALRAKHATFRPFVFETGTYSVKVGSPERQRWKTYEDQSVQNR